LLNYLYLWLFDQNSHWCSNSFLVLWLRTLNLLTAIFYIASYHLITICTLITSPLVLPMLKLYGTTCDRLSNNRPKYVIFQTLYIGDRSIMVSQIPHEHLVLFDLFSSWHDPHACNQSSLNSQRPTQLSQFFLNHHRVIKMNVFTYHRSSKPRIVLESPKYHKDVLSTRIAVNWPNLGFLYLKNIYIIQDHYLKKETPNQSPTKTFLLYRIHSESIYFL